MTDADVDGAHILTFFLLFLPVYETSGRGRKHLYCSSSSLSSARGENDYYAFDDEELEQVLQGLRGKNIPSSAIKVWEK